MPKESLPGLDLDSLEGVTGKMMHRVQLERGGLAGGAWLIAMTLANVAWAEEGKLGSEDFVEQLAAKARPSIVVIESVDRNNREGGTGTGYVVREDGVIATNFHVIGEHRGFRVKLSDGKIYEPKAILAVDRDKDLALIQIDRKGLPTLSLGDSSDLTPGQGIMALGNPLGFDFSVSRGVVAALRALEGNDMIQVAIPIEPGSSGSPVLDVKGRVIGTIAIKSGGAMGFAVPVNDLRRLLENPHPIPMKRWLTIGALDPKEWQSIMGGIWKQRAGIIKADGMGSGFGGRMLCLRQGKAPKVPFDLEVEVRLENESGAAGLAFHSDGGDVHYGFYPTGGALRLTRFDGPTVFNWTILKTVENDAYNPGEWNRLRVSLGAKGELTCSVNDKVVIDLVDAHLTNGSLGLLKFRQPQAEFRRLRFANHLPIIQVDPLTQKQTERLIRPLSTKKSLEQKKIEQLVTLGQPVSGILLERAKNLEAEAGRLRYLADQVRERLIIKELVATLRHEDESSVNLLRAALLLARLDNEDFDLDVYLERVERIAGNVADAFPEKATGEKKLGTLVEHLFDQLGYHGSTGDYVNRSNSYLNEVIDDREGLPITLSILFIELANKLDLPVSGVGIPRHFIAMYREEPNAEQPKEKPKEILIDVFGGGKFVTRKEAAELSGLELTDDDFEPASKRSIILRMLRNLLNGAEQERDAKGRMRYLDAILAIDSADEYSRAMRAMINYGEGLFDEALLDIEILIEKNPEGPETAPLREIRERLINRGKE
jgi:serine protease Do